MNDEANLYTDLNESILRSLFDSSPQGVVVVREGEIIYINNALRKSVGIQSREGIPENIDELRGILSSGFQEDAKDRYSSILSGHVSTHQGKFEFIKENGEKNYLDISSNAITVNGKKYIIAYSIDVTGDKIAKDALTRERKAYSIIAEAALSTESVENLCESILEGLVSTLGFDLGTIRLYDEGDESLHLKAIVGLDEGDTPKVVHRDDPDFLVARTARTLSPLFTSDIEKTGESHERMSRAKQLKVRSLIFWPIIGSEHNLLGVINIAAREPKSLGQGDRTVFATIAGMFSTILERRNAEREL
ncbi:MAG: GAF domain-containing protein, partial [Promethearchaeota archaeon]